MLRSLRVRLTLWYVLLLAATLAVFSAGVYFALREALYSNLDDSLDNRAATIEGLVVSDGGLDVDDVTVPGDPLEGEEFARVYDADGELVLDNTAEHYRPDVDADAVQSALAGGRSKRKESVEDVHLEVVVQPLRAGGEVVGAVEVGLSDDDARDSLQALLLIIVIAYPVALLAATAGGVFLAGRALSPIDRVTQAARRISAEDLGQRLDLRLPDDEVGRLARTFDEMIARLDDAFERQRQFTADASHELRTPLTAIKGQAEVALQRDRTPDEYREVLRAVNQDVDRMIRLVGSLLTLARADAARIPIHREPIDLAALVADVVEQVRPLADEKGVTISVAARHASPGGAGSQEPGARILADQDLLLQLLLNLLDNAVKYTPSGGRVEASWREADGGIEVRVSDTGPGIAPEHLPHIFDRFYRVDRARSRSEGGAGLGLSISRWIAEAHGGTLRAESAVGQGTSFVVWLPG